MLSPHNVNVFEAGPSQRKISVTERRRRGRYLAWGVSPRDEGINESTSPRRGRQVDSFHGLNPGAKEFGDLAEILVEIGIDKVTP